MASTKKLQTGSNVKYFEKDCIIRSVYPYIVYLEEEKTGELICACIGDLVMAGLIHVGSIPYKER